MELSKEEVLKLLDRFAGVTVYELRHDPVLRKMINHMLVYITKLEREETQQAIAKKPCVVS